MKEKTGYVNCFKCKRNKEGVCTKYKFIIKKNSFSFARCKEGDKE